MPAKRAPDHRDLGPGGKKFWTATTTSNPDLSDGQKLLLLEVCRIKDKLDLMETVGEDIDGRISYPQLSALMAKHLAQLRLPGPGSSNLGRPAGATGAYAGSGSPTPDDYVAALSVAS